MERSATLERVEALPIERFGGRLCMVGGKPCHVGKLSINQWLALSRFIAKAVSHLKIDSIEEARNIDKGGWSETIQAVLPLLSEDLFVELYATMTDLPEQHLLDTFDMVEFLEVVDAIGEHNDVQQIIASFGTAAKRWSSQSRKLSQRSASSDPPVTTKPASEDTASNGSATPSRTSRSASRHVPSDEKPTS